jgi:tight adherence protein B
MPDTTTILYGLIFFAAVLLAEGIFILYRDYNRKNNRQANQRLRLRASGISSKETLLKLRQDAELNAVRDEEKRSPFLQPVQALAQLLRECGVAASTSRVIMIMVGLSLVLWLLMLVASPLSPVASLPMAIIMGISIPIFLLLRKKRLRLKAFQAQLPDALDMMVRSLRAGHPIRASMTLVAEEMDDPMGSEMGITVDEVTYGLDLREALENFRRRIPLMDLQYMVVTINIQFGTGGNLGEILSNLSSVIRDRFRLLKKVDALSAEGRLAAVVVGCIPAVIGVGMSLINPVYYTEAMGHKAFFPIAIGTVVLYFISMFAIYKIVHIRV